MRRSKKTSFFTIALLLTVSVLGNAICFYVFDNQLRKEAGESLVTIEDSLWYSVISITTIGYGDLSSQSTGARAGTFIFIVILGLSTFGLLMAVTTDSFVDFMMKGQRGMSNILSSGHTLIVNFPGESRVKQIIEELHADPSHDGSDIVIVTDQIDALPFDIPKVEFVYGSPLEVETFERANLKEAKKAIVLAISYTDNNSDPVVASVISVIEDLSPDVITVGECLSQSRKGLFKAANCDSIVLGLEIAGNLLVQETNDHGVAQTIDTITSNLKGTTLFSTKVNSNGIDYNKLAKSLLDYDCNLLSVIRDEETFTTFKGRQAHDGDIVVYVSEARKSWEELLGLAKE